MANRAYLYPSDNETYLLDSDWEGMSDGPCYDSRHTIPVSWFFFFDSVDIVEVNILSVRPKSWYQEPKLRGVKEDCVARFRRCISALLKVVGTNFDAEDRLQRFVETVERWPGQYLLMDPVEIITGGSFRDEDVIPLWQSLFQSIIDAKEAQFDASRWKPVLGSPFRDRDDFIVRVIGYTYA